MSVGFIFGGNTNETPESLKRKREMIEAMIMGQRTPQNWGEGAGALLKGIAAGIERGRLNKAEQAGQSTANDLKSRLVKMLIGDTNPDIFGGQAMSGNIPMSGAASEVDATAPGSISGNSALPSSFLSAVDRHEGAGGYNTLFGHAERSGPFAGTDVSQMSIGDALAFSDPSGPYAQHVKGKIGRVATPMGRHQIVGKTLRSAVNEMGLDPSTPFNAETQDAIAMHLAQRRIAGAGSMQGKIAALRSEWHGFRNVPDAQMIQIVSDIENGNGLGPILGQGGEVASATPEAAFGAIMPELRGSIPANADPIMRRNMTVPSLSDEVSAYQQTPEYRQQFPGMGQQGFDAGRFGDPTFGAQPVQGMDGLQSALAGQQQQAGQQAINDQMQAGGLPRQFQGSQQLMGAQGGMMPALMGGQSATEQQLAQTQARGQQQMDAGKVDMGLLMQVISDPFMDAGMKQLANAMLQQELQKRDPSHQLDMDYRRAQVDKLNRDASAEKRQPLINAGGGAIYDPNTDKWLRPPAEDGGNGAFRFGGNSVEAQALNGLMDSGQLTPEQAQQLGAGKTITGPNGEIIFLTPQGVFGSSPDGKTQRLSSEGIPADNSGISSGNITITEPKVTLDERKAMGFADRMTTSGALIDGNEKAGLKPWDQFVRGNDWIPDFAENWLVGEDFQKFDQARRDFVNAQLRRESGAVISDEEFGNANQQYFPQPGDTEDVLKQKAQNRKVVIEGMKRDAGPTYRAIGGDPLADARKAIAAGADRNAVIQRLRQNGIDPGGL